MEHEICKVCGFPFDHGTHADCVFKLSQELDRLRGIIREFNTPQVENKKMPNEYTNTRAEAIHAANEFIRRIGRVA
jgi:hypothetical protein